MARGVRTNATLLPTFSGNLQPQSLSSYDPKTRRNTVLIAEIVPTLALIDSARTKSVPADRYYANLGAINSTSEWPFWADTGSGTHGFKNWDSSDERLYIQLDATNANFASTTLPFIYPTGPFGTATTHAPKNASATAVFIKFRARFPANADYTVFGIGANDSNGSFNTVTYHFIQVLRNTSAWELGTADGAAISQSSGGTGDGSWHDFKVRWAIGEVTLYVDDVLTITKSTNLPTRPLLVDAVSSGNDIDMVDYLVEWEVS